MLFELDSTLANIDARNHKHVRAIENLLGAFQSRNHLIFADMKTLRTMIRLMSSVISSPSRAMLNSLLNSSVENKEFVSKLDYKVVVFISKDEARISRINNYWRVSLDYLSESGLLQTAVMGENELDAELFLLLAELYRRKEGIRSFGIKARIQGGGGSGLPKAMEKYLDNELSPFLTISDSDKYSPESDVSLTVKKCIRIANERLSIVEFIHLEEREIENLIPQRLLEKIVDLGRFLDECDGTVARCPAIWPYLDLKNGASLKWIRAKDERTQGFWQELLVRLERKRKRCTSCDADVGILDENCDCSKVMGFGTGLLEKCIGYLKDTAPHLSLRLMSEDVRWERIGKIAFHFAIVPLGERAI